MHQGKLWLDQPYPRTLEHIRDITGLSMDGPEIQTFQHHKRANKIGEEDLYTKRITHIGSKGAYIASITTK
jgi:hypothetical protein